jgi:cob(I)alamin adenosyltransferase
MRLHSCSAGGYSTLEMKTKYFTGTGDDGNSRVGGRKISKRDPVLAVLGMLDELNSWVGLCRVEARREFPAQAVGDIAIDLALKDIQNDLFVAQAELAATVFGKGPGPVYRILDSHVSSLEVLVEELDLKIPALTQFVVSGGTELAARLHVARTIARRVERGAVGLSAVHELPAPLQRYLNRLSSALFALARYAVRRAGVSEEHPRYE